MIGQLIAVKHFFFVFFFLQETNKKAVLKINSKYALKSQLCHLPFYYLFLKHKEKFSVCFSAGLSCYLIWGVLLEAGVSPQPRPRRDGMWCWRHSRSWECFAFHFLAVVRWLPARMKDNKLPKEEKKRRGKEQFIIRLLWRRHFYSEPNWN